MQVRPEQAGRWRGSAGELRPRRQQAGRCGDPCTRGESETGRHVQSACRQVWPRHVQFRCHPSGLPVFPSQVSQPSSFPAVVQFSRSVFPQPSSLPSSFPAFPALPIRLQMRGRRRRGNADQFRLSQAGAKKRPRQAGAEAQIGRGSETRRTGRSGQWDCRDRQPGTRSLR